MAAQKLTRARFVQIIIMLTLLIVAFTWRTMSYKTDQIVTCNLKTNCVIDVNGTDATVEMLGDTMVISKPDSNWDIVIENAQYNISEQPKSWEVKLEKIPSKLTIIFQSKSDKSEIFKVVVSQIQ